MVIRADIRFTYYNWPKPTSRFPGRGLMTLDFSWVQNLIWGALANVRREISLESFNAWSIMNREENGDEWKRHRAMLQLTETFGLRLFSWDRRRALWYLFFQLIYIKCPCPLGTHFHSRVNNVFFYIEQFVTLFVICFSIKPTFFLLNSSSLNVKTILRRNFISISVVG